MSIGGMQLKFGGLARSRETGYALNLCARRRKESPLTTRQKKQSACTVHCESLTCRPDDWHLLAPIESSQSSLFLLYNLKRLMNAVRRKQNLDRTGEHIAALRIKD